MPAKRQAGEAAEQGGRASAKRSRTAGTLEPWPRPADLEPGAVLTFGQNSAGELGLDPDEHPERTLPTLLSALKEARCVSVVAGGMHTVALTQSGKVYTFGCNDEGPLGRVTHGEQDAATPSFAEGLYGLRVIKVTAGDSHTCALTDDGRLFAAGMFRDASGQWAFNETMLISRRFVQIYPPVIKLAGQDYPPAHDVASGAQHVVLLAEDGTVFTLGCAEQGQLGRVAKGKSERGATFRTISDADLPKDFLEELEIRRTTPSCLQNLLSFMPVRCPDFARHGGVRRVFAGGFSSAAVTHDGTTFSWGLNNYGQLAIAVPNPKKKPEDRVTVEFFPKRSKLLREAPKLMCSAEHHVVALTESGRVLTWGRGDMGELGYVGEDGERLSESWTPREIGGFGEPVVRVVAGGHSSFAISASGRLLGWGSNTNGQVAAGDEVEDLETPTLIRGKRISAESGARVIDVDAGGQHTVVLAAGV